jgi:hypothetical protein
MVLANIFVYDLIFYSQAFHRQVSDHSPVVVVWLRYGVSSFT